MSRAKQGTWASGWASTGFGEKLTRLRERAGISQTVLALRVNVMPATISKLERGVQEPAWPLVVLLAKELGVSVAEFEPAEYKPAPPPPALIEHVIKKRSSQAPR